MTTMSTVSTQSAIGAVTGTPRRWLRIEGLAALLAGAGIYLAAGGPWLLLVPFVLAVDVSMVGYLAGPPDRRPRLQPGPQPGDGPAGPGRGRGVGHLAARARRGGAGGAHRHGSPGRLRPQVRDGVRRHPPRADRSVSPTPARTSRAQIVAAARTLLEEEGLEAVTMATVAARVGVRPPSLYKHVRDRGALLEAVAADAAGELGRVLAGAADGEVDPEARVAALAHAYRAFAHRAPRAASILFTDLGPGTGAPLEVAAEAARPVVEAAAALVGPADSLAAARVLTSFAYGFTSMEGAGAFRLGGNVDDAFRLGVETLVAGLAGCRPAVPQSRAPGRFAATASARPGTRSRWSGSRPWPMARRPARCRTGPSRRRTKPWSRNVPQQPVPQEAVTGSSARMLPSPSRIWTRNWASKTLAMPLSCTGLPAAAPQAGRSTKIAGRTSR